MDNANEFLVYKLTSPSGKSYVGKTNNLELRLRLHKNKAMRGENGCPALAAAIRKYGFENFSVEILFSGLTEEQAFDRESQAITGLNTFRGPGYNLTEGGDGPAGVRRSDAYREACRSRNLGKKASAETRAKMSESQKARKRTSESAQRISEAHKRNGHKPTRAALDAATASRRAKRLASPQRIAVSSGECSE